MVTRRQLYERLWLVAVIAWAVARILAVQVWLTEYGVNVWVFAVVEIVSSVPYGIGTARCVVSLVDRRVVPAVTWGVIAAVSYLAPDVYMLSAGEDLPPLSVAIIISVVAVLGATSLVAAIRKYRALRAAR